MNRYEKIGAKNLFYLEASNTHPANTYFHFSFANYYDPENMNFGVLRVLNDDEVTPKSGFDTHHHSNMEIFSYIVEGKLTHRDSAGNHETLNRGDIQAISAGTGLTHSELNKEDSPCRFLQIWILPEAQNLSVEYNSYRPSLKNRKDKLLKIISGTESTNQSPLHIHQDVNAYVSELTDKEITIPFVVNECRQAYLYCFEGSIKIDPDTTLEERDSLKIYGESALKISLVSKKAHFIIIEMKQ